MESSRGFIRRRSDYKKGKARGKYSREFVRCLSPPESRDPLRAGSISASVAKAHLQLAVFGTAEAVPFPNLQGSNKSPAQIILADSGRTHFGGCVISMAQIA